MWDIKIAVFITAIFIILLLPISTTAIHHQENLIDSNDSEICLRAVSKCEEKNRLLASKREKIIEDKRSLETELWYKKEQSKFLDINIKTLKFQSEYPNQPIPTESVSSVGPGTWYVSQAPVMTDGPCDVRMDFCQRMQKTLNKNIIDFQRQIDSINSELTGQKLINDQKITDMSSLMDKLRTRGVTPHLVFPHVLDNDKAQV